MGYYNGRPIGSTAFAQIAEKAGWMVIADVLPGHESGLEFHNYLGGEWVNEQGQTVTLDDVLIGWSKDHTAPYIAIGGQRISGPLGLITARKHIEDHSYATA
jgi:hypothetical protein